MKRYIVHIVQLCLAVVCPMLFTASCADADDEPQEPSANQQKVQMILRVSATDGATPTATYIPENERMHSLRIIVLDGAGAIEHNLFLDFSEEPRMEYYRVLTLRNNEERKIYLIANEESVGGLHEALEAQTEGDGGFEQFATGFTFTPDYTKPLPMTSCYPVSIGTEKHIEKTFHVVYAATKFDIAFNNHHDRDVKVNSFTLSAPASSMYLMAHLEENAGVYKADASGKGVKTGFVINDGDEALYWINWLKYAADESQANPTDETLADKRGWILEYAIPEGAQQTAAQDLLQTANNGQPLVLGKDQTTSLPTFYLPESKNLAEASAFAPKLEQEYKLNLVMTETDEGGIRTQTFSDLRLPNLRALFRNTHVSLNITLKNNILVVIVDLCPYTSKELFPLFGLDV